MFKQTLFMVFCNFQMLLLKNVKFGLINFQLSLLFTISPTVLMCILHMHISKTMNNSGGIVCVK
jgi:hypothetical protein